MQDDDDNDYDDDDDDDDPALAEETLDDIVAIKSESAVVLDKTQIQESAAKEIERIATITDTSLSTAGALLRAFQWNSEKLLERYYENPEKVMKEAGVTATASPSKGPLRTSNNSVKLKPTPTDCEICGDSLDSNNSCTLECLHVFCRDCLSRYLEVQVNEGKSLDITCMAFKCKGRVPDNLIRKFTSAEIYAKYTAFVSKSFVEDNPNIKWCPRAGCGNAVKSDVKSISEAQCSCGFKFCFKCNGEAHAPGTCNMMKEWLKKCQDDSETSNWISVNTKDCPKCNSAIEKNGGCNHMTCRKCKHEFCWICMGNWSGHAACNKFVEDSNKSMDRAALERYLHYYHRYQTHEQSKKFEQTLREAAVVKMVSIQNTDSNRWIDVQYIDTATEQLIECRRTLKYTYVFAFYMINGPEKNLFEYLQAELEKTTEQLSGYLEAPIGSHAPRQIKDVTGLAGKRLQHLREGVEEMMENTSKLPILAGLSDAPVKDEPQKSKVAPIQAATPAKSTKGKKS
jgi:ariadne-1